MKSSFDELSTVVSDCLKCKEMKDNTYKLNSVLTLVRRLVER